MVVRRRTGTDVLSAWDHICLRHLQAFLIGDLAADLLADPLPACVEAERDHPALAAGTGLVVSAVPAVVPVVEVDAVFAVAPAFRLSHAESLQLGSHAEPPEFTQWS